MILNGTEHNQYHVYSKSDCTSPYESITGATFAEAQQFCSEDPGCGMYYETTRGSTRSYRFCAGTSKASGTYNLYVRCKYFAF